MRITTGARAVDLYNEHVPVTDIVIESDRVDFGSHRPVIHICGDIAVVHSRFTPLVISGRNAREFVQLVQEVRGVQDVQLVCSVQLARIESAIILVYGDAINKLREDINNCKPHLTFEVNGDGVVFRIAQGAIRICNLTVSRSALRLKPREHYITVCITQFDKFRMYKDGRLYAEYLQKMNGIWNVHCVLEHAETEGIMSLFV
jgi:hypothetical protein